MLSNNKLNVIIDGQFGSTGKGLVSCYVGKNNKVDLAITNASPNAGHTFYIKGKKYVTRHLPVTGIINKKSIIYLCSGAIINPKILMNELKTFRINKNRIFIHPRAAVIEDCDINFEKTGSVKKIASTMSGVGKALSRKINRTSKLAMGNRLLKPMVKEININKYLNQNKIVKAVIEVPQGFDLSINSGLSYPYCTSREITVSSALSDAQVNLNLLGKVIVCIRTFPIRVGNILEKGKEVGNSGPFYSDSIETSWDSIGVRKEYTTNTKRIRRVATFSMKQYKRMIELFKPDYVFLTFANYLSKKELSKLIKKLPEVTHISYSPMTKDIVPVVRKHTGWNRLGVKLITKTVGGKEVSCKPY